MPWVKLWCFGKQYWKRDKYLAVGITENELATIDSRLEGATFANCYTRFLIDRASENSRALTLLQVNESNKKAYFHKDWEELPINPGKAAYWYHVCSAPFLYGESDVSLPELLTAIQSAYAYNAAGLSTFTTLSMAELDDLTRYLQFAGIIQPAEGVFDAPPADATLKKVVAETGTAAASTGTITAAFTGAIAAATSAAVAASAAAFDTAIAIASGNTAPDATVANTAEAAVAATKDATKAANDTAAAAITTATNAKTAAAIARDAVGNTVRTAADAAKVEADAAEAEAVAAAADDAAAIAAAMAEAATAAAKRVETVVKAAANNPSPREAAVAIAKAIADVIFATSATVAATDPTNTEAIAAAATVTAISRRRIANVEVMSYILFNEYGRKKRTKILPQKFSSVILGSLFLGMPPNHHLRMKRAIAQNQYSRSPQQWQAFLQRLKSERDSMNTVAGLISAGSLAFAAFSDVTGVARVLVIISAGSSLSCIIIGFNPSVNEWLLEAEGDDDNKRRLHSLSNAIATHFVMLWISSVTLLASLIAYSVIHFYFTVREKSMLVPLIVVLGIAVLFLAGWNGWFRYTQHSG